jgi:hypothetical protein
MSWLSEFVFDPAKALVNKALASADAELKKLAGLVAETLPASPIADAAETAFETAVQSALDGVITYVIGEVPVVGKTLEPEAVAAANAAIDYAVTKGAALLNAAAAAAKAKLTAVAAQP